MKIFEFEFGVYIKAEDEQTAYNKVSKVVQILNDLDIENDASINGPFDRTSDFDDIEVI